MKSYCSTSVAKISECTSANLFIVTKGKVLTPPLVSGCLPGVTRALLLEEVRVPGLSINEKNTASRRHRKAPTKYSSLPPRASLLPVDSIEGWNIRTSRESRDPSLAEAFRRCVDSYGRAAPPARRGVIAGYSAVPQ